MLCFYNINNIEETITIAILTKVAIKLNSIPPLPFENKKNTWYNENAERGVSLQIPVLGVEKARKYPWEQANREAVEGSNFLKKKKRTEKRGTDQLQPKNYGRKEKRKIIESSKLSN